MQVFHFVRQPTDQMSISVVTAGDGQQDEQNREEKWEARHDGEAQPTGESHRLITQGSGRHGIVANRVQHVQSIEILSTRNVRKGIYGAKDN